jgi:hypothetical protein
MKTIKLYLLCILSILFTAGCSNDTDLEYQSTKLEDLQFHVNVINKSDYFPLTRSYSNKKCWKNGDIIYVSIDKNDNKLCKLTYQEDNHWSVKSVENATFENTTGQLSAVYGETVSYNDGIISTSGDVLYTNAGSYTKSGNAISIDLNMNQRPLSRITVNGIGPGYVLQGQAFSSLSSFNGFKWLDTSEIQTYNYDSGTAVYFGLVNQDSKGMTEIKLINNTTGETYYRTYNKYMSTGNAIVINGPTSPESAEWNKKISVTGISLDNTNMSSIIGDEFDITATITPLNAENKNIKWSSSNESIATVTAKSTNIVHVKILNSGSATIIASTEDNNKVAQCNISANEITDFIRTSIGNCSFMNIGGIVTGGFGLNILNNFSKSITFTHIYVQDYSTNKIISTYSFNGGDFVIGGGFSYGFNVRIVDAFCTKFNFITEFTYNGKTFTTTCTFDADSFS